ncbi:MFS transporter [Vibrio superstes]|uniref:Bcr/CflA family drug resistance efflux transporter n=1 Tax=Vibrio superstes NBRC 103154 TaxID=1219062 RepID=A0A511QNJ3_9VIBR|nr:MFS transporter [Vibrio superstes]GEM78092.1 Bcr/CflA family drug resistance efflux transporter [Vibrio superstes NBRC 103154]
MKHPIDVIRLPNSPILKNRYLDDPNLMNAQQKTCFYSVFALTLALGFAVDIMVPSLPAITQHFGENDHSGSLIVSSYLMAYAITQILSGYISDVLGRKWLCSVSAILFSISLFMCAHATSLDQLITLRVVQGFCAGFFGVIGRAVLADVFEGEELSKHFATLGLVWAMGPIIAPFIGGHMQTWFGWQSVFYFLSAMSGVIALFVTVVLTETLKERIRFNLSTLVDSYSYVLTKDQFIRLTIAAGMVYAIISSFNVFATYIFQQGFDKSADFYGQVSLLMGVFWLSGQIFYRHLLAKKLWNKQWLMRIYGAGIGSGVLLAICFMAFGAKTWMFIAFPAICFFTASIIYIHTFVYAFSIVSKKAGTASSLVGCISAFVAGATPALTAKAPFEPTLVLIASMVILFIGNWLLNLSSIKQRYPD